MTDEQIIKAFEEIIKNQNDKLSLIEQAVCADVLSLIKRTKDESNKHRNKYRAVKAEFTRLYDTVCCQKAEIERLQIDNKQLQSDVINANQNWGHIKGLWECEKEKVESAKQKVICVCKTLKTVKSEAIKEFAERLKRKITAVHKTRSGNHWYEMDDDDIDNLVKEMTEVRE